MTITRTETALAAPLEALARVPLFAEYDQAALGRLAAAARIRRFRRGQVVFHRGDPGTTLFVIASGRVKITVTTEDGGEALLAVLGPGEFFGELSLLDGAPRSATAVAMEAVELWTLHRDDALRPLLQTPGAAVLLTVLARRLRRADTIVEELAHHDLDTRLARALIRLYEDHGEDGPNGAQIDLPMTQTDLAAMVGATRPRVNVLLGAYQDAGLIRLTGRTVVLRDLAALRLRAGLR